MTGDDELAQLVAQVRDALAEAESAAAARRPAPSSTVLDFCAMAVPSARRLNPSAPAAERGEGGGEVIDLCDIAGRQRPVTGPQPAVNARR